MKLFFNKKLFMMLDRIEINLAVYRVRSPKRGVKNFFSYLLISYKKEEQTSKNSNGDLLLENIPSLKLVQCLRKEASLKLNLKRYQIGI